MEVIAEIVFCEHVLKILRVDHKADSYALGNALGSNPFRVFLDTGKLLQIATVAELAAVSKQLDCPIKDIIGGNEKPFAFLISVLLNKGRIISEEKLYLFLEDDFPVKIADCLPVVRADTLLFTLTTSPSFGEFELHKVSLDLHTLTYVLEKIPKNSK